MTRKTIGYTELEWTCKRCNTINPGLQKTCTNCGAPMTTEDSFELPDQQILITDKEKLETVKRGADIHCPYCGARNQAGVEACIQCGGDLKSGTLRQSGQTMGSFQDVPVPDIDCPFCAAKIKADSTRCPNCGGDLLVKPEQAVEPTGQVKKRFPWKVIGLIILLIFCVGSMVIYAIYSSRTNDVRGVVQDASWRRVVQVLELRDVRQGDWQDNLPKEARNISCSDRQRRTSNEPVPKSTEVCGTPYTIDTGSGLGEVVQDCVYQVYDSYCEYTLQKWQIVDQVMSQGTGFEPTWPNLQLKAGQRQGERLESYVITFNVDGKLIEYPLANQSDFEKFTLGSQWTLKVNPFGSILEVEP